MKLIHSLRVPYGKESDLKLLAAENLGISAVDIDRVRVTKKSLDARTRNQFYWVYSLEVFLKGEKIEEAFAPFPKLKWNGPPPLIIGAGPAGLFAAWTFLQHGIKPILFERGERTHERMKKISRYWRHGVLDPDSNVCHGEGGAGTFSDGKLITRIKSPHIPRIMRAFVDCGAPEEITYVYNPHVGSNLIRNVIRRMSDDLIFKGADLRFSTRVTELDIAKNCVQGIKLSDGTSIAGSGLILACGHSAGNFFSVLKEQGIHFEPKPFALGLRIEHPQSYINRWQYGENCPTDLGAAQYKLTAHWEKENIGTYSFCMCPGGYVVSSSTDADGIVVNGMSNYHRNSPFANAAVVVSVATEKIPGADVFKMLHFQRGIEKSVFEASCTLADGKRIPAQRLEDFLLGREGLVTSRSSCPSGIISANLSQLLPKWIYESLHQAFGEFEKKRRGFCHPDAVLHAVESRTSSPVRITRRPDTMESINTEGLFPCGEGPGYAGGITSAAADGIEAALAWINKFCG